MVKVLALRDDGSYVPIELDDFYLQVGQPSPPSDDSPYVPKGYVRTFAEEFGPDFRCRDVAEGAEPNEKWIGSWDKWNVRILDGNDEKALKIVDDDTHVLSANGLSLRGLNRPSTAQSGGRVRTLPYTAGMISTERSFWQKYGYWEIKAAVRTSKGHHVAAGWLLSKDGSYNNKTEIAEVDLVEVVNGEQKLYFNHHGPGAEGLTEVPGDPTEEHVYGLLWEPDRMKWFLDGNVVRISTKVMPREAYFLASIEIGGKWPGAVTAQTVWPCSLDLRYVRVYRAP